MRVRASRVAVVCALGLGDALLSMILTNNLSLSRAEVVTYSSILSELKSWFPQHTKRCNFVLIRL